MTTREDGQEREATAAPEREIGRVRTPGIVALLHSAIARQLHSSGEPTPPGKPTPSPAPPQAMPTDMSGEGLTKDEAAARLARFGPNVIEEETRSPVQHFLAFFWGPLPWMMEVAAALALALRAWGTFWVILGNLVLNAVIAFWEELRANRAITSLRAQLAAQADVRRDGAWRLITARDLVPGDVIRVRPGDVIPADALLLSGGGVALDRSSLTGESLPVECARGEVLQAGTVVRRGIAEAVVVATGTGVHFANTIRLVQKTVPVGHLQRVIVSLGRDLIAFAVALDILLLTVVLLRRGDFAASLEYALLLAVAAVPVSMPTVFSVTMAAGAQRLARRGALVGRLAALEELAAMDVLCVDKTGTLTQNALQAGEPFCLPPAVRDDVLRHAALASLAPDPLASRQDPIDAAIRQAYGDEPDLATYTIVSFTPFDSDTKRSLAAVRAPDGASLEVAKGAVQAILALAAVSPEERLRIEHAVQAFARRGFRALAVASAPRGGAWRFEGIIPLYDPVRPEARDAIAEVQAKGVALKVLTGDQRAIGQEIAQQLGLGGGLLEASALAGRDTDPDVDVGDDGVAAVEAADGFAQVLPADKYRIVEILQRAKHVVGMTGDGVNDAPALRRANVGIAVQGATEAARAASDLVVVRSGLTILSDGISESRRIFGRMRTYVIYRVAETMRRLLSLTIAVVAFSIYPLTPAMLALLATLNALVLIALAYDEVRPAARPERWRMHEVLSIAVALSAISLVEFFGLFFLAREVFRLSHLEVQTLLYLALSAAGYFTLLVARTRSWFWTQPPAPVLLLAMVVALGLGYVVALLGWFMPALDWQYALLALAYSAFWFLVADAGKVTVYRLLDRGHVPKPARMGA
jgi:H+-transporting ATPase